MSKRVSGATQSAVNPLRSVTRRGLGRRSWAEERAGRVHDN